MEVFRSVPDMLHHAISMYAGVFAPLFSPVARRQACSIAPPMRLLCGSHGGSFPPAGTSARRSRPAWRTWSTSRGAGNDPPRTRAHAHAMHHAAPRTAGSALRRRTTAAGPRSRWLESARTPEAERPPAADEPALHVRVASVEAYVEASSFAAEIHRVLEAVGPAGRGLCCHSTSPRSFYIEIPMDDSKFLRLASLVYFPRPAARATRPPDSLARCAAQDPQFMPDERALHTHSAESITGGVWTHPAAFTGFKAELYRIDLPEALQRSDVWKRLVQVP
jgi:hypothetical protein